MSFCANVSELVHELRIAAGTVLTTLGSRLEADARAQVECGPQWLTEFEEQREVNEPDEVCAFHGEWCAGETAWCARRCSKCDQPVYWHPDTEDWFHRADVIDRPPCPYGDGPVVAHHASAATPDAADPSPANVQAAGDEGSGGASDILQSAPPEHLDMHPDAVYGRLYVEQARRRKSDPGEVFTPSPGERTYKDCRECGEPAIVGMPCTNCLLGIASDERVFKHLNAARQFLFHQTPPNKLMAMEKLFHAVLALAQK